MKHKTLRTLLCVILTVCFCLSAIVPASAAGLFGGESGIASQWDQWIRSMKDLKDRIIEKNPGTDETPAEPMAGAGEEFIRIFHLDCGRKYFSVQQIKDIIDQLEANHYTHIELAFGNDGFRFLLDDMAIPGYTTFTSEQVKSAIQTGNQKYSTATSGELTESEMNDIIAYANGKGIGVIPMIDVPGHANALIDAMTELGISVSSTSTGNNSAGVSMRAFQAGDNDATKFVVALVEKYVDYFREKGSAYFNIAGDECGYSTSFVDTDALADNLFIPLVEYIKGDASLPMTPMMFNDGFRNKNTLADKLAGRGIVVCFWEMQKGYYSVESLKENNKFSVVNTHNKWYYVAGKEYGNLNGGWSDYAYAYNWAISNMEGSYSDCTICDGDSSTDRVANTGCMLAFWCDNPGATVNYDNLYTYINKLSVASDVNKGKFTGNLSMPAKPAISGVPTSVQISDGTLNVSSSIAARWTSSNNSVITFEDAATKAAADSASYTKTATARIVGAGTAIITATTANRGWSVQTVTVTEGNKTDPGTPDVPVTENRTITVTVGGTAEDTISGANYKSGTWTVEDSSIATIISVDGTDAVAGKTNYTEKKVNIKNLARDKTDWTATDYYYKVDDGLYYRVYVKQGVEYTYYTYYYYGYKSDANGDVVQIDSIYQYETSSTKYNVTLYQIKSQTDPTPASTTVTFKGVAEGTTYATVGHVKYTIKVEKEVLTGKTLPIQLWITNNTIEAKSDSTTHTGSGWGGDSTLGYANYVNVSAQKAYGEDGISLLEAIGLTEPLTRTEWGGTRFITARDQKKSQNLVLWTARIHNSSDSNIQTVWGTDYSNSGSAFNYVRYYGGEWAVSADGKTGWTTVTGAGSTGTCSGCTQQLAAYYMTRTEITEEVTTDVADWGKPKDGGEYDSQVSGDFVLLDFAVKYEDGTQNPKENEFPVSGKTLAYHCEDNNAAVGTNNGTKYRMLNNFRAVNTTEYEVYKVTVTMTSGSAGTQLTANAAKNGYTYDSTTEQIVWAIDEAARDASGLEEYTSISGSTTYSGCKIGGNPDVRGVEVYNKHGVLITYYIRAKVMEDSLIVNYFVDGAAEPFYHYNINVDTNKPNSTFKLSIALDTTTDISWKGKLVDGDVVNIKNQRQWVSADLGSMPEIGAQYRYSNYKCVRVVRESDKVVNLYYTFEAKASFVVDFGLPLIITPSDLNADLGTIANITGAIVSDTSYATVKADGKNIIYTLKKPLDSVDTFTIQYVGKNLTTEKEGDATYDIKIIPANNVYYEENFMTAGEGWSTDGTASSVNQTTDTLGGEEIDIYGFDSNLSENDFVNIEADPLVLKDLTYSNGSAYHAQLTVADSTKSATTKPVSFTFTGTGFDLVSECNDKTGILIVTIAGKNNRVKKGYIVDTFFCGDNSSVIQKGTTVYQVPVVRELELAHDTYDVKVYGYITPKAGVVVGPTAPASVTAYGLYNDSILSADSIIADALKTCGITDISVDDVEVVYMDDNSILNGGSGVPDEAFISAVSSDAVATMSDTTVDTSITADFYLDAFRVYNPLTDSSIYNPDKEDNVTYQSLFDSVWDSVKKEWLTDTNLVYVEYKGNVGAGEFTVESYKKTGPQNELYLAPGCGIAFGISLSEGEFVHVSAKAVTGNPKLNSYDVSSTELYYNIDSSNGLTPTSETGVYVVTIQNNGSGILAVSGLKLRGTAKIKNSSETTQIALEKMARAMSGAEEYAPLIFNVSVPSVARRNRSFGIGISVTADKLDHLTVKVDDGVETTLTPYNAKAVALGDIAEYAYMHSVRIKTAGTHTITVTAYDANGNAATVTRSVEIK